MAEWKCSAFGKSATVEAPTHLEAQNLAAKKLGVRRPWQITATRGENYIAAPDVTIHVWADDGGPANE